MKRFSGWILAVLLLVGAVRAGGDKKELDLLQGSWMVTDMVEEGEKVPADEIRDLLVTVQGPKLTVRKKGMIEGEFILRLDPTKTPKVADFIPIPEKDTKGKKDKEKLVPMLGIYQIRGDTAMFCFDEEGKVRPTEFASKAKSDITLVVLKKKGGG